MTTAAPTPTPFDVHISNAEYILDSIALSNQGGAHAIAHALIALAYVIRDEMAEPPIDVSIESEEPTAQAWLWTVVTDGRARYVVEGPDGLSASDDPRFATIYPNAAEESRIRGFFGINPTGKSILVNGKGEWRRPASGSPWVTPEPAVDFTIY